ncbi:MAG: BUD32 family EKC/KEOPS complex subunit [Candidatus Thorarchaeota archaeon SMTZ1-45]
MGLLDGFHVDLAGADGKTIATERLATLESLLHESFGEISLDSATRLRSKKNVVLRLVVRSPLPEAYENLVTKMFISDRYQNELERLQVSLREGLNVPEIIAARDGVILMTYIPGDLFVTRINHTFDSYLVDQLALWYYQYHAIHEMIKGDPRLRNFICTNEGIVGLDFEESRKGHWMSDIGGVAASLLDTDPIDDIRKRKLAWRFLTSYLSCRSESRCEETDSLFVDTIAKALKQTNHWRKDERIFALSEQIRAEGIPID